MPLFASKAEDFRKALEIKVLTTNIITLLPGTKLANYRLTEELRVGVSILVRSGIAWVGLTENTGNAKDWVERAVSNAVYTTPLIYFGPISMENRNNTNAVFNIVEYGFMNL